METLIGSAFSDEVILFNGVPNSQVYNGSFQIGLKQAFPQGAGDVDAFANVEFISLGSFSLDTAFLVKHVRFLFAASKFSKF